MKKKPLLVILATIYYCLITLFLISLLIIFLFGYESLYPLLFILLLIPYALALIVILMKPKSWHHTYCSTLGNISGFAGIADSLFRLFMGESITSIFSRIIFSIIIISLFLTFEFSEKSRKYFLKSKK